MTKAQLALAGAKLKSWFAERAAERQKALAGTRRKTGADLVANSSEGQERGRARDLAAKAVGVSGTAVDEAAHILKHAVPGATIAQAPRSPPGRGVGLGTASQTRLRAFCWNPPLARFGRSGAHSLRLTGR